MRSTTTRAQFSEKELADLTLAVAAINSWNRIAIGFRAEPGTYQPPPHARQSGQHAIDTAPEEQAAR